MRGDLGSLFDAHAARLHAYCWSLLGDRDAADAVADAFVATRRHPPRGDDVLWLYALARSACAERGAFARTPPAFDPADPLLRAAAALRPDHREALLLWAGEWLDVPDIARVLGVAPDTAHQLLQIARSRLERAVLDVLMHGAGDAALIEAFEDKRLPRALAERAPDTAPAGLRDRLTELDPDAAPPLSTLTAPNPIVLIGPEPVPRRRRRGLPRAAGALAGVAATVAAAIGLLASWPSAKGSGVGAIVPSSSNSDGPAAEQALSAAPVGTPPATTQTRAPDGDGKGGTHGGATSQYDQPPAPVAPPAATPAPPVTPPTHGKPVKSHDPASAKPPAESSKPPATSEPSKPTEPSEPSEPTKPTEPTDPATPPETDPPTTPSDPPTSPDPGSPAPSDPAPAPSGE